MIIGRSCILFLVFGLGLNLIAAEAQPQSRSAEEYTIKAKFIWNFIKFTQWPETSFNRPDDPIVVNVMYDIPACETLLKRLDGLFVIREDNNVKRKRQISVKRVQMATDVLTCHVFYFGTNDTVMIQKQLAAIGSRPILTIGETEGFEALCGMINFFQMQNRQAFRVNHEAAKRTGLKLSSQILRSAEIYVPDQPCFYGEPQDDRQEANDAVNP